MRLVLILTILLSCTFLSHSQPIRDSLFERPQQVQPAQKGFFHQFGGSFNTLFNQNQAFGSLDLSAQTFHYFLITGKRFKNDSIHQVMVEKKRPIQEVFRGFHFFVLNRTAVDFDTIRAIANNYLTSLQASPLTLRVRKEIFLTKSHVISTLSNTPVISIQISSDARAIPYGNLNQKVNFGASGHLFVTLATQFRRIEYASGGQEIDDGTMYLRPMFGIAYGTKELMQSVQKRYKDAPLLTSGCRLGFKSERNKLKDFSFLVQYTLTDIIGPKLRAGIVLSSL